MKKLLLLLCVMCLLLTSCAYEEGSPAPGADVDLEYGTDSETASDSVDSVKPDTASDSEGSTDPETASDSEDSTEPALSTIPEISGEPVLTATPESSTEPVTVTEFSGEPVLTSIPEPSTEPEPTSDPYKDETVPGNTNDGFSVSLPELDPVGGNTGGSSHLGGTDMKVDNGKYSENAKLLTADDIYLSSSHCGYISGNRPCRFIIETEKQLSCALREYGLPLDEMSGKYPISDYTYVVEYIEVSSGGYDLKAGALLVDTDRLRFVQSEDSRIPDPSTAQTTMMDGFCYMAALPKGMLASENYKNWTYPESSALLR